MKMSDRQSRQFRFSNRIQPGIAGLLGLVALVMIGGFASVQNRTAEAASTTLPVARTPESATYQDLNRRIRSLAGTHPNRIKSASIGKSPRGREIPLIEIRDASREGRVGAMLIVAGVSASRVSSTDVALALAERWADPTPTSQPATAPASQPASQPAHILDVCDVYIVPRLNVDGAERFLTNPADASDLNDEPVDDDRDRVPDDNGPADLNGDGVISLMRVRDPEATHMIDDKDARLIRPADRAAGERPVYKIYTEGLDSDGDGEYAEDGPGGVDLDRNFPHGYKPHAPGTGRYPLSAPETRALAEFVIAHPEILAVVVLDRGDNLASGNPGSEVVPDDEGIWKHIAERYKAVVGLSDMPRGSADGSLVAWAYRQRGLPAVASALWQMPKDEPTSQPTSGPATSQATTQATSNPSDDDSSDASPNEGDRAAPSGGPPSPPSERMGPRAGRRGRPDGAPRGPGGGRFGRGGRGGGRPGGLGGDGPPRVGGDTGASGAAGGGSGDIDKDRQWLKYFDKHPEVRGYVNWTPFKHPTLGDVEIGGFVSGVRENAPADAIDKIVEQQIAFCSELAAMLPQPRVAGVKVTEKATGVYELELTMINDAYLPTALAMTRTARLAMPFVLRPDLPPERILAGRPVEKIPYLDGEGGTDKVRWLVQGEAGSSITIKLFNKQFKVSDVSVELTPTASTTQEAP